MIKNTTLELDSTLQRKSCTVTTTSDLYGVFISLKKPFISTLQSPSLAGPGLQMTRQSLGNPWIAVAPILRGASAGELVRAQRLSPTLTESDSEGGGRGPGNPGQQVWGNLTQVVMRPHFGAPQVSELLRSECWNWAGARLLMVSLGSSCLPTGPLSPGAGDSGRSTHICLTPTSCSQMQCWLFKIQPLCVRCELWKVAGSRIFWWASVKGSHFAFPKQHQRGHLRVEFGDAKVDLLVGKDLPLKKVE